MIVNPGLADRNFVGDEGNGKQGTELCVNADWETSEEKLVMIVSAEAAKIRKMYLSVSLFTNSFRCNSLTNKNCLLERRCLSRLPPLDPLHCQEFNAL